MAAVGRRVKTLCKGEAGWPPHRVLLQSYHHFVLPHASLRQPLVVPERADGRGATQGGRPWTPAMAAGLPDHVWSRTEVLLLRGPPWPQPQAL